MSAPAVIKWSDAGSPALTRTAGSLINVLNYCLPQRGWVKEFSGTDKAVFRAGTGERKYYRILNDNTVYVSSAYPYTYAKITAYDSMTDVDTGAGWGASQAIMLSFAANVVRPWICIFDENTVFVVTMPQALTSSTIGTCSSVVHAFGDTVTGLPGESDRSFLAAQVSMSSNTDTSAIYRLNTSGIQVNRSIDGTRLAISSKLKRNGGDPGDNANNNPMGNWSYCPLSYPFNNSLLFGRPMIDDAVDYSMGDFIPGLFYPCHKGNGFNNTGVYTDIDTGKSFMAILISGEATMFTAKPTSGLQSFGALLVDLGDWRA